MEQYRRYPKLWLLAECSSHLILGLHQRRGPTNDDRGLMPSMKRAARHTKIETLVADAGFDSEVNHRMVRKQFHVPLIMPPLRSRPTKKLPTKFYRRKMAKLFKRRSPKTYRQRWQIETVVSMIKRNLTSCLSARQYHQQNRELALLAITHNLAILATQ